MQTGCGRFAAATVATAALLACTAVLGIVIGSTSVGLGDVLALTFGTGTGANQTAANVILNIRLPRVLAALLAGAALAQAGALIQAALDNPLASPNIIGVNAGSGFFVLLAACVFPNAFGLAPAAAFLGALCVAGLIFAVAGLGGPSRLTVVLAGMAFTAIFTAGMNAILIVNPDAYVGASGFLVGGLSGVKLSEVFVPGCAICAVLVLGLLQGTRLNLLSLGEHQAPGPQRPPHATSCTGDGSGARGLCGELCRTHRLRGTHRPARNACPGGPRQSPRPCDLAAIRRAVGLPMRLARPHNVRPVRNPRRHRLVATGRAVLRLPHFASREGRAQWLAYS